MTEQSKLSNLIREFRMPPTRPLGQNGYGPCLRAHTHAHVSTTPAATPLLAADLRSATHAGLTTSPSTTCKLHDAHPTHVRLCGAALFALIPATASRYAPAKRRKCDAVDGCCGTSAGAPAPRPLAQSALVPCVPNALRCIHGGSPSPWRPTSHSRRAVPKAPRSAHHWNSACGAAPARHRHNVDATVAARWPRGPWPVPQRVLEHEITVGVAIEHLLQHRWRICQTTA